MPPVTKFPPPLCGSVKGSFAYITVKDRWPKILAKVVDSVHRKFHTHFAVHGEIGSQDTKSVISALSELRYLISTNKQLRDIDDDGENKQIWNETLKALREKHTPEKVTWYQVEWLYAECYLYRCIASCFMKTTTLKDFDPFASQKQNAFIGGLPAISALAKYTLELTSDDKEQVDDKTVGRFLQMCLWGNQCDLSLSCGENVSSTSPIEKIDQLADKILCNELGGALEVLRNCNNSRIDIILDNAGLELFGDMCLAELLFMKRGVRTVVFHGKSLPWFVSDVTSRDFNWLLEMLLENQEEALKSIGKRFVERLEKNEFIFQANAFWTLPFSYYEMASKDPELYRSLSQSSLLIFKGDLNYRKLMGDLSWPLDTPFKIALRGFLPAPLLVLRTLKAETQAGLSSVVIEKVKKGHGDSKGWMVSGEYGVMQFVK